MDETDIADVDGDAQAKLGRLRELMGGMDGVAVAFSAGVDSTFLLHVAHEALGERAVAVTVRSPFVPPRERDAAAAFCSARGIRHEFIDFAVLAEPHIAANPPDRCYLCKRAIFLRIAEFARENGLAEVVEGDNKDDEGDFRPGRRAIRELGIRSPLHEVGLTKAEIRALSRELGLPTWNKPSAACLASRFPYGDAITAAALKRVDRAERWLLEAGLGLTQLRVRVHGSVARIEVPKDAIMALAARSEEIVAAFKEFGYAYVTLDLCGYRMGSMNETLDNP